MSVVVAKLRHSFMGIFIRSKMIVNKKRPPWQEVVFNVTNNLGKLSPQGGDLVQNLPFPSSAGRPGSISIIPMF